MNLINDGRWQMLRRGIGISLFLLTLANPTSALEPISSITTDPDVVAAEDTIRVTGISVGAVSFSVAELVAPIEVVIENAPPGNFDFHWGAGVTAEEPANALEALGGFDLSNGVLNPGNTGQGRLNLIFSETISQLAGPELFIFNPDSGGDDESWQVQAITGGTGEAPVIGGRVFRFGEADFAELPLSIAHQRSSGNNFTQNEHGVSLDLDDLGVPSLIGLQITTPDGDPSAIIAAVPAVITDPEINALTIVDFGIFGVSDPPAGESLVIENAGASQDLVVSSAAITGADAEMFNIESVPPPIGPGEAGQLQLAFDAGGQAGIFSATLTFSTNDPDESTVAIALRAMVSLVTSSVDAQGREILESVMLPGRGSFLAAELTNVEVFSFNFGGGNNTNLIQPGGVVVLPDPRQRVLEDLALNSGIINPGAGSPVPAGTTIDDAIVGLGLRFTSPVADAPGTDAILFELSVQADQLPDGFSMALLDDANTVIGNEFSFNAGDYLQGVDQADATPISVGAGSLNALNTNPVTNSGVVDAFYNLLEIDFANFGIVPGTTVFGIYIRGANVDTTLVAGLNPVSLAPFAITEIVYGGGAEAPTIKWNAVVGRAYAIDFSTDLQRWLEIDDGVFATDELMSFTDPDIDLGPGKRYYRVRLP